MVQLKVVWGAVVAAAVLSAAAPSAQAATYNFDVIYSGNNMASLAPGSDDPLSTSLMAGDSFIYSLTAQPGSVFTTISSGSIFPLFALDINESGTRVSDILFNLNYNGSSVFSVSQSGVENSYAHLGTNTIDLPSGLVFNQFRLDDSLISSDSATNTPISLLPWPGRGPELYSPGVIAFTSAAPEPAAWALMIAGVGVVGGMLRRGRRREWALTQAVA